MAYSSGGMTAGFPDFPLVRDGELYERYTIMETCSTESRQVQCTTVITAIESSPIRFLLLHR